MTENSALLLTAPNSLSFCSFFKICLLSVLTGHILVTCTQSASPVLSSGISSWLFSQYCTLVFYFFLSVFAFFSFTLFIWVLFFHSFSFADEDGRLAPIGSYFSRHSNCSGTAWEPVGMISFLMGTGNTTWTKYSQEGCGSAAPPGLADTSPPNITSLRESVQSPSCWVPVPWKKGEAYCFAGVNISSALH